MFSKNFVCASEQYCTLEKQINAPLFRKKFVINQKGKAIITICGLGFYELYFNGKKITKGKFAPYISNPDDLLYYDEYNVSNLLADENVIGILLGNGFLNSIGGSPWNFDKADFRSAPKFALSLEIDGKLIFEADNSFKLFPSPILFDDLRMGEYYDARLEVNNWLDTSFDDSTWQNAIDTKTPLGEVKLCHAKPIKIIKEIKPVKIIKTDGGFIYDFGINSAGVCRLKIKGRRGQIICFQHGEALTEGKSLYVKNTCTSDADRHLSQRDRYICSGNGFEIYEPHFTYHGFRYVFIEGVSDSQATDDLLTFLIIHSEFEKYSYIKCNNDTVDRLQEITLNSDLSNFYYFPTDCPQREKNGWTADAALSCEQMLYNFDCSNSLKEWLNNIRKAQKENGQLPGIIPTAGWGYEWGNGPAWDSVIIELPYQIFRFTGDLNVIEENISAIEKYIYYLNSKKNKDGLIAFGLPDWCETGGISEDICSTPLEITDSLVAIELCQKSEKLAKIANKYDFALFCKELKNKFILNFRKKYLDKDLYVNCKTQTAQAKALDVEIFSGKEKNKAFENLIKLIENNKGRFHVGVIGARILFRVLSENGQSNLAFKLITQDCFPSYKYWLDNGATSLWEGFNEVYNDSVFRKDGGRVLSLNHHFWGDISGWFFRYILGININPNLNEPFLVEVNPHIIEGIDNVQGSFVNKNGKVHVEYLKNKNGNLDIKIKTEGKHIIKRYNNKKI